MKQCQSKRLLAPKFGRRDVPIGSRPFCSTFNHVELETKIKKKPSVKSSYTKGERKENETNRINKSRFLRKILLRSMNDTSMNQNQIYFNTSHQHQKTQPRRRKERKLTPSFTFSNLPLHIPIIPINLLPLQPLNRFNSSPTPSDSF